MLWDFKAAAGNWLLKTVADGMLYSVISRCTVCELASVISIYYYY